MTARRLARVAEPVALVAALIPAVVMVIRAIVTGWVPLFDAAYFTIRSRDVMTTHNPLVGAWSMGSREVGVWINNLGPLQLDLLAPFTKLDPYWGTAVGVAATNVASIVGVWLVARRLFGSGRCPERHSPVGVVGAMAATILIQLNEGSQMLIEARQQLALVLPMWCLLWLAAAAWQGHRWAMPWMAFVASVVLQTHFTYAYQTLAVAAAASVAFVVHHRSRRAELVRPLLITAGVTLLCWAQPLWDQVDGTGNMANVLGESGGSDRSVGASRGVRILAESVFVPPFFTPGSMGDLLRQGSRTSLPAALVALLIWALLLGAVGFLLRRTHATLSAMGWVGLVTLAGAVVAAIKIPPTEQFGIIAQNYYWVWPMGIFMGAAIIGAALQAPVSALRDTMSGDAAAVLPAGMAVATALAAIPLLSPTDLLPESDHEWFVSREIARPLMVQLAESLDEHDLGGPVLIDLGSVRHVRYTLLAELQRRDIDFRFNPGATDLSRFGRGRCDDGSAGWLLTLRGGPDAIRLDDTDTLMASVPGLSNEQSARMTELAELFGGLLSDGTVTVDDGGVEYLGGDVPPLLDHVRNTGMPARQLSEFLSDWSGFGAVQIPDEWHDELEEFKALELRAATDRMAIYLRPISPYRPDLCDQTEPGEEFLVAG